MAVKGEAKGWNLRACAKVKQALNFRKHMPASFPSKNGRQVDMYGDF